MVPRSIPSKIMRSVEESISIPAEEKFAKSGNWNVSTLENFVPHGEAVTVPIDYFDPIATLIFEKRKGSQ